LVVGSPVKYVAVTIAAILVVVLLLQYGISPQKTVATTSTRPIAATPSPQFDTLFAQYGPGWTGGDGTYSLQLPNGSTLWMFSDSYIGTVNPTTDMRSSYLFNVHNALALVDKGLTTFTTVYRSGTSVQSPGPYFATSNSSEWYWINAGIVTPNQSEIKILLTEWTGNYHFLGDSIATLSLPSLNIVSIQPLNLTPAVEWTYMLQNGTTVYIYGTEDDGLAGKYVHVAKTSVYNLSNTADWTFWNGSGWAPGQSNSARDSTYNISNGFSVSRFGNEYVLVGLSGVAFSGTIVTLTSPTPEGPWSNETTVYQIPGNGENGLIAYGPLAHPEFMSNGSVLVSYNVNNVNSSKLTNASNYRARFIWVPVP
jgi:hypothetical protein